MIVNADARSIPLTDGSVHCVVTSPPYWGLRDYGMAGQLGLERTPEEYVAAMVTVFREVWRVLRDDGTLWLNLGDSYNNRTRTRVSSHQPGLNGIVDGRWKDRAANGGVRMSLGGGLKEKDLIGLPWMIAFALRADGWYLRSDIVWSKPNPMPESVTDRPTKAHEYLFLLAKSERYFYDSEAIKESSVSDHASGNGYARPEQLSRGGRGQAHGWTDVGGRRNRRSVWEIATQPYPEAHFATFPEALVEPCVLAGSPAGGMVLDPFAGSGTVGLVCQRLGRRFVGIELKPEYCAMAYKRTAQMGLV